MCPVHEWSSFWMVWVHRYQMMIYHSKTGHFCPVFKWLTIILTSVDPNHLKTGHFGPVFKCLDPLNTELDKVGYSDESSIRMSVFRWLLLILNFSFVNDELVGQNKKRPLVHEDHITFAHPDLGGLFFHSYTGEKGLRFTKLYYYHSFFFQQSFS